MTVFVFFFIEIVLKSGKMVQYLQKLFALQYSEGYENIDDNILHSLATTFPPLVDRPNEPDQSLLLRAPGKPALLPEEKHGALQEEGAGEAGEAVLRALLGHLC